MFLDRLFNQLLDSQSLDVSLLKTLENKIIQIQIPTMDQTITFQFKFHQIQRLDPFYSDPDLILKATPLGLIQFYLSKQITPGAGMIILGDLETGYQLQALFHALEINWQACLENTLGADLSLHVSAFAGLIRDNILPSCSNQNALFPTQIELETYLEAIDRLKVDVERIEAKIELLSSC